MGIRRKATVVVSLFLVIFFASASFRQVYAFFPGGSFNERVQNYINDNGAFWVNKYSYLDPPYYQHQTIWAWLENNSNPQGVHKTIGWFLEDIGGSPWDDPSWPWQVYWAKHSHLTTVTGLRVLLQYGDSIRNYDRQYGWNDYQGLKNRYDIGDSGFFYSAFGNNNFAFTYTMPGYLWAEYFDPNYNNSNCVKTTFLDTYHYGTSWTYNGHTYEAGKSYCSYQLYKDNAMYLMERMVFDSDGEWQSDTYSGHVFRGLYLLHDFAQDQEMKRRAKMSLDFLFLEAGSQFSAHQWGGFTGRTYCNTVVRGDTNLPWVAFFGDLKAHRPDEDNQPLTDMYVTSYRIGDAVLDVVNLNDEPDNYWHLVRGHQNEGRGNPPASGEGIYTYVTKYYNLGGANSDSSSGWKMNIGSDGENGGNSAIPFKLWINDETVSCLDDPAQDTNPPLGGDGSQNKNTLFNKVWNATNHLWVYKDPRNNIPEYSWDGEYHSGGWDIFQEGKVGVAVAISGANAGLQVALLGSGLDYSDFDSFRSAVTSQASLGPNSFTSSKGLTVNYGSTDGDLATFPRIRVEDYQGKKVADWTGEYWNYKGALTVNKNGLSCEYNFNNWTYSGNGCGGSGGECNCSSWQDVSCGGGSCFAAEMYQTRSCTPSGCSIETRCISSSSCTTSTPTTSPVPLEGDLDGDCDVDIFDYNIILENFGYQGCGNVADIDADCDVDIFDYNILLSNFGAG